MIMWLYQSIFTVKYTKLDIYARRKNCHHKFRKIRPFIAKYDFLESLVMMYINMKLVLFVHGGHVCICLLS